MLERFQGKNLLETSGKVSLMWLDLINGRRKKNDKTPGREGIADSTEALNSYLRPVRDRKRLQGNENPIDHL